jgi:hypothetical protein
MRKSLSQGEKVFLFVQGALALVFGLLTYVDPRLMAWIWPDQPNLAEQFSTVMRVVGAAAVAAGITGLAVWRTGDWEKVKPTALFIIVFYILAGIALLLTQALGQLSLGPVVWVYGALSLLLGIGWLYLWRKEEGSLRLGL